MKLVRLVLIALEPARKEQVTACIIASADGVEVQITPISEPTGHGGTTQLIAKVSTHLPSPMLDAGGFIIIPDEPRHRCESAIMRAADLFAIATRSRRQIVSGTPPAALIPESDSDRALVGQAVAIRAGPPRALTTFHATLNLQDITKALSNRWDGVAMLAEAYSHTLMGGRYRDLVRLFELAFARSFMQMEKSSPRRLRRPWGTPSPR